MPAIIPALVGIAATAFGATQVVAGLASLAATFLVGNYQDKKAARRAREQHNAAQVDRLANVSTTITPRDLVLGRARKGGAVYFRGSAGAYKERFLAHLALAGHEIDAVEQVYLNDNPVSLDANGYVLDSPYAVTNRVSRQQTIPAGSSSTTLVAQPIEGTLAVVLDSGSNDQEAQNRFVGYSLSGLTLTLNETVPVGGTVHIAYQAYDTTYYARVWWELGSPNAVADSRTIELFPDLWTGNHRGQGVAKLFAEFVYNDTAFPTAVPNLTAVVRGAKCYDPRTELTAWTENPALHARHVYSHSFFGKATVSEAEDERFIAAANDCDETYSYIYGTTTATVAIYRSSLVVPFGTPAKQVLDDLVAAMAGRWAHMAGELYIAAGAYSAPVMTLTDADLAVVQRTGEREEQDEIQIQSHRERNAKFNILNPRIWDAAQEYKQVALTPVRGAALITRDGEELAQDITLSAINFHPQAQHVCGVLMRDARDPVTAEIPFKMRAYPLELFDTIAITLARYGWTAKVFVILGRVWDQQKGVIRLTLKETSAAIFTPDAQFLAQGYAPNTALPQPWAISPPALAAARVASGTDQLVAQPDGTFQTRVRVWWPPINNGAVNPGGQIEVQWSVIGSESWNSVTVPGSSTEVFLIGPVDGTAILIRARSRNNIAISDWSAQVSHVVVGKLEAPDTPTGVALTRDYVIFTPVDDIDVKGYRILYNVGTNTNRSVATALHTGLVPGSPWPLPIRLYNTNTILVVAVDAVGNEGGAGVDTQDLGPPDAANVAEEVDFVEDGYPGTITNGSVVDGVLVADADPSADFYGTGSGTNIYFRDGAADIYGGSQYLELQYVADYRNHYDGGILLIDLEFAGSRSTIEVRVDGSPLGDVYDDSRSDFYGTDIGSIYGDAQQWALWNGSVVPAGDFIYQFRVTIDEGSTQGQITTFTVRTEMPTIEQTFGAVTIDAGGTFLDPADGLPARSFTAIEDVQITPIGATAVAGRVKTYPIDPDVGPLIELIDSNGDAVSATAFVRVGGW